MRTALQTTTTGLRRDSFPMRLYEKAKKFGIWDPSDIDFSQDVEDWKTLTAQEQDVILRLTTLFQGGEEAVTLDLLPLIQVIAEEGRLEEEMYLTTFLFEEAKHTDFFRRFLDDVAGVELSLEHYVNNNYRTIFYEALPTALQALRTDASPQAQARASATYNIIVEGMLAETGYHAYFDILESRNLMPGTRKGVGYLKQDESRHLAYGIYLLSRLLAEHPDVWDVIESTLNTLVMAAVGLISEIFAAYDFMPFDLKEDAFINYGMEQFQKRYARLEQARQSGLNTIETEAISGLD